MLFRGPEQISQEHRDQGQDRYRRRECHSEQIEMTAHREVQEFVAMHPVRSEEVRRQVNVDDRDRQRQDGAARQRDPPITSVTFPTDWSLAA